MGLDRDRTVDWIVAAGRVLRENGFAMHKHPLECLGILALLSGTAPFEDTESFNPFGGQLLGCLSGLYGVLEGDEPLAKELLVWRDNKTRPDISATYSLSDSGYQPGAAFADYYRDLSSYVDDLGCRNLEQFAVAWHTINILIEGEEDIVAGIRERLHLFLSDDDGNSTRDLERALDLVTPTLVQVGELVGTVAARRGHDYLTTLAVQVRQLRREMAAAKRPLTFGL